VVSFKTHYMTVVCRRAEQARKACNRTFLRWAYAPEVPQRLKPPALAPLAR